MFVFLIFCIYFGGIFTFLSSPQISEETIRALLFEKTSFWTSSLLIGACIWSEPAAELRCAPSCWSVSRMMVLPA